MKTINIDLFIDLLKQCKQEGCTEIIFRVEPVDDKETHLVVLQQDRSVIVSTKKMFDF